ncbi:unnamed protein product [Moneuplotes crassus]|uniref:Uncharacterized protein n=1 Tax=Euplotes crassus TaxID=5936 RepID=A0AAD1XME3_EUPCR|nr:unnamed protein product [Moneuplotes crassus]
MKKVVVVGDTSVGKTSLVGKYVDGCFAGEHFATVGVDFRCKNKSLSIWDTGGQERFKSITKSYFKGAHAVILVYACDCEESFLNLINWLVTIESSVDEDVVKVLIANKSDIEDISVSHKKGRIFAEENDMLFYTCSSVTGENIDEVFDRIIDELREIDTTDAITHHKDSFLLESCSETTRPKKKKRRCALFGGFGSKKKTRKKDGLIN